MRVGDAGLAVHTIGARNLVDDIAVPHRRQRLACEGDRTGDVVVDDLAAHGKHFDASVGVDTHHVRTANADADGCHTPATAVFEVTQRGLDAGDRVVQVDDDAVAHPARLDCRAIQIREAAATGAQGDDGGDLHGPDIQPDYRCLRHRTHVRALSSS